MKLKTIAAGAAALASFALVFSAASAHVSVQPKEVGVGKLQTFSVGVPVERDVATVGLRLVVPEGLGHVTPNVKPGWKITIVHGEAQTVEDAGSGDDHGSVKEIIWTGGTVPSGQRDDFLFSAQAPAEPTTLQWKAYQTYQDGVVVAWELEAGQAQPQKDGKPDYSKLGPVSETRVINDLDANVGVSAADTSSSAASATDIKSATRNAKVALAISVASLLIAAFAVSRRRS